MRFEHLLFIITRVFIIFNPFNGSFNYFNCKRLQSIIFRVIEDCCFLTDNKGGVEEIPIPRRSGRTPALQRIVKGEIFNGP